MATRRNPKFILVAEDKGLYQVLTASSAFKWVQTPHVVTTESYTQYEFELKDFIELGSYGSENYALYFGLYLLVYADKTDICLYYPKREKYWSVLEPHTAVVKGPLTAKTLERVLTWVDIQVAERIGMDPMELIVRRLTP